MMMIQIRTPTTAPAIAPAPPDEDEPSLPVPAPLTALGSVVVLSIVIRADVLVVVVITSDVVADAICGDSVTLVAEEDNKLIVDVTLTLELSVAEVSN